MSPFDRVHMISYSSLIETMRLSCTVFEIWWVICRNSPPSTHPTCIWRPVGDVPVAFPKDFWHQKTRVPGLSCGLLCVILRLAVLVEHRLVTDSQTHSHSIYRAEHSSRGKNEHVLWLSFSYFWCYSVVTAVICITSIVWIYFCWTSCHDSKTSYKSIRMGPNKLHCATSLFSMRDRQLFKAMSISIHCLHHLIPPFRKVSYAMRKRGHPYEVTEHKFQKNKCGYFVRSIFQYVQYG